MTISAFTAGTYFQDRNTANLVSQKARLETLTAQLTTGRNAETYGGIGSARTTSLSAHASLSALDGYDAAINANTTRVTVASSAVTQLSNLSGIVQGSLNSGSIASGSNAVQVARNSLDAAVDALNQDVAGNYIFGGRDSDAPPVASSDAILNGIPSRNLDGLKTVVSEQIAADLGPNGNGRIATSVSDSTVTISEEDLGAGGTEARANFGFSLVSAASSNPAAITAGPMTARTNPAVTFSVANAPAEGDRIRVAINQPDGTQTFTDLIVTANPPADATNTIPLGTAADTAAALTKRFENQAVASIQGKASLGLAANFGTGTPASVELAVKAPPAAGDTLTFKLALRDGTTQTITLTAKANADAKSTTEFSLTGDVAANISTALSNALKETGRDDPLGEFGVARHPGFLRRVEDRGVCTAPRIGGRERLRGRGQHHDRHLVHRRQIPRPIHGRRRRCRSVRTGRSESEPRPTRRRSARSSPGSRRSRCRASPPRRPERRRRHATSPSRNVHARSSPPPPGAREYSPSPAISAWRPRP